MTTQQKELIEKEAQRVYPLQHKGDFPNRAFYNAAQDNRVEGFKQGAQFALSIANPWIKIEEGLPDNYSDVLWMMEDGNICKGFINAHGEFMTGNQGRWASEYSSVDNPIVKWQPLPPTE